MKPDLTGVQGVALYPRLLGDIGGTHARLAWQAGASSGLSDLATYAVAAHESLEAVIRHYLRQHGRPTPEACALGVATPVTGDQVVMTNHAWTFSVRGTEAALGVRRLVVINDFTALALGLPDLTHDDLVRLDEHDAAPGAPLAVLGPGTGLGVSGLLRAGSSWLAIQGEGGHVSLAPADEDEAHVCAMLRRRFGHVSAERAISGPGLVSLYEVACELAGVPALSLSPAGVAERGRSAGDPQAARALELFFSFLGGVAGNLALTLGARGGVYIAGGIVPRMIPALQSSSFRERFEGKGRFRSYLKGIPVFVVSAQAGPALHGASRALDQPGG